MPAGPPRSLFERDAELRRIAAAIETTTAGDGRLLVVVGPGGIGKSALLAEAARLAAGRGAEVATARGAELEREFPFGLVRQLFEPLLAAATEPQREAWLRGAAGLARPLFEVRAPAVEAPDAGYARLHGLYWLAANLASERPLVLAVDDAQRGDEASLAFLEFLARRVGDLPLMLAVGTRPPSAGASLAAIVTEPSAVVIRPAPLTSGAVAEWVEAVTATPSAPEFAGACHEATGGNPLLLKELLLELAAGTVEPTAAAAGTVRALGPRGVSTVVLLRLARLGDDAPVLARAIAVLGDGARVADAAGLAGLAEERAAAAAVVLAAQEIIENRETLAFVHPIVRAAVYEDIPALERGRRHGGAAELLHARGAPAEEVAAHLLAGPSPDAPWVVDTLATAGARAAALGDPAAAVPLLRLAADRATDPAHRAALLMQLGMAAAQAGSGAAEASLAEAIRIAPTPDLRGQAAVLLGSVLKMSGQGLRAVKALREVLDGLPEGPVADRLDVEVVGAGFINLTAARAAGGRIRRLRDPGRPPADDTERLAIAALAWEAAVEPGGSAAPAAELALRSVTGTPPSDPIAGGQAFVVAAVTLSVAERLAEADALLTGGLEDARRTGSGVGAAGSAGLRAWVRHRAGDVAAAEADAHEALRLGAEVHASATLAHPALAAATWAALERDADPDEALALDRRFGVVLDADVMPYSLVLNARAELLLSHGQPEAALELALACDRAEPWWGRDCPALCPWRSNAALALRLLCDTDRAAALAREEVRLARAFGGLRALGIAQRAAALVATGDERLAGLRKSVAVLERSPAALELARARLDLGAELRRRGRREAAREPLRQALDAAAPRGATRLARLAREELEASGARLGRTLLTGREALTPSELRVAGAAVDGRTNREIAQMLFLSQKTVETHLSSVHGKLGVRSRRELPEVLGAAAG